MKKFMEKADEIIRLFEELKKEYPSATVIYNEKDERPLNIRVEYGEILKNDIQDKIR